MKYCASIVRPQKHKAYLEVTDDESGGALPLFLDGLDQSCSSTAEQYSIENNPLLYCLKNQLDRILVQEEQNNPGIATYFASSLFSRVIGVVKGHVLIFSELK